MTTASRSVFSENARIILCKRYFWKGDQFITCSNCQVNHETEEQFFDRISLGNTEYRGLLESLCFLPNSPTLFNLGTGQGTLSACFKFDVQDNMESIMDVARKSAMVQKWGGGVGYYFGNLRPYKTRISTTHGGAMGPVGKPSEGIRSGVLHHYHSVSMMITQAGKRDGAQMGILPATHPDIREFIHVKDVDPQSLSTFNISVSITDSFMEKVRDEPESEERKLFVEMAHSAWKTGDPGCYFVTTAEKDNPTPWLGELTGTNPCGEVPLLDNEPCNLGSINLGKFVRGQDVYLEGIRKTARVATRYLDEVLDNNIFPDPAIDEIARKTRKLGLGVMGWADMLALLEIPYESDSAVDLAAEVMEAIQTAATEESEFMGQEKGLAPALDQILDEDSLPWKRRNATVTCIAPTGTISILAGASSGCEPHYAITWKRTMGDGTKLEETIPVLDELEERGSTFIPQTAHDISPRTQIRHQAAFQRFTDLAVSKTVNLPKTATPDDVFSVYMLAWEEGCKGVTVYRDGSRELQVLDSHSKESYREEPEFTNRIKLPKTRKAITHHFEISDIPVYMTVGLYPDTKMPGEVFITTPARGGTIDGLLDSVMISLSLGLQHGTPLELLVGRLKGKNFEPKGFTDNPLIPNAVSIIDYMVRWLEMTFLEPIVSEIAPGLICPGCESTVVREEGCLKCTNLTCGWSKC